MSDEGAAARQAATDGGDSERPKRRKKKKAGASGAPPRVAPTADPDESPYDPLQPAFAAAFPPDDELARLVALFEAGDYMAAREGAQRLARATDSDEVRRAAREIERRTEADPLSKVLLGLGAALLVFLSYWYWSHPHAGP